MIQQIGIKPNRAPCVADIIGRMAGMPYTKTAITIVVIKVTKLAFRRPFLLMSTKKTIIGINATRPEITTLSPNGTKFECIPLVGPPLRCR